MSDVQLRVDRGEIVGLLGQTGAGKTTTLRMLAGLLKPDGGELRIQGTAFFIPKGDPLEPRGEPSIVLLDEPFDVDPVLRPGIEARLRDLARRGIAVLFADHNAKGALDFCDRAYVMVEGRIVIEGSAPELLRR